MKVQIIPFPEVLSSIVDNRGKTCPTAANGIPLIATNCLRNEYLYPSFENVRYVDTNTFREWFRGHPEAGDILVVTKGTPGRVCLVPDPVTFCIAQDMVAVRADPKKIDPLFLFALLRAPDTQAAIETMHVGTMIPHFKKGDFDKLLLPVPDRKMQEFIGKMYFQFSAKIELNRRMNETLEAMARAVFRSWFVDFDPVRAKADGRQPAGMDAATAALFPNRFVDSPLGPIPAGWQVSTVGVGFDLTMGQSPPGETYNEAGNGLAFFQGRADFGFRYPTPRVYCTAPTRFAEVGDTLVSVRAPVGDVNMADRRCCIGRGVAAVRHKSGSRSFTYHVMHGLAEDFALFEAEGTVFGSINKNDFAALKLIHPPPAPVAAFEELIGPLDQRIENNEIESRTLAAIRDALLPKLLSGELRLPEAEAMVESVA